MKHQLLHDVKEDHHFILVSGKKLKNIKELHDSLEKMDNDTFKHHVNNHRNDFHSWVNDIHQDAILAKQLKRAKSKKQVAKVIAARINDVMHISKVAKRLQKSSKSNVKHTPPPQKHLVKSTSHLVKEIKTHLPKSFLNSHFPQILLVVSAFAFLFTLVGITSYASTITAAVVGTGTGEIQFLGMGGMFAIIFLLVVALYTVKHKQSAMN
ncbi:hypothetical protein CL620_02910 [archaeon]|nr:hypothetical protein [archaeon]